MLIEYGANISDLQNRARLVFSQIGAYNPFTDFDDYEATIDFIIPMGNGGLIFRRENVGNPNGGIDRLCWMDIAADRFFMRVEKAHHFIVELMKTKKYDFLCTESVSEPMWRFLDKIGMQRISTDGFFPRLYSLDIRIESCLTH